MDWSRVRGGIGRRVSGLMPGWWYDRRIRHMQREAAVREEFRRRARLAAFGLREHDGSDSHGPERDRRVDAAGVERDVSGQ